MAKTKKNKDREQVQVIYRGPSIYEVAYQVHCVKVRECDYCGRDMTESDVNDYGSLCERCYMREYYGED